MVYYVFVHMVGGCRPNAVILARYPEPNLSETLARYLLSRKIAGTRFTGINLNRLRFAGIMDEQPVGATIPVTVESRRCKILSVGVPQATGRGVISYTVRCIVVDLSKG